MAVGKSADSAALRFILTGGGRRSLLRPLRLKLLIEVEVEVFEFELEAAFVMNSRALAA